MAEAGPFKLFIADLPGDITEQELTTVFQTYGEVVGVHILLPNAKNGGRAALLTYSARQSAEDAISVLNGQYKIRVDAQYPIKVQWAREKSSYPAQGQPAQDQDGFKLFVGGLPADCTIEEVTMVFSTYGEVNKVHLMPPHAESGRVAGFVYYKNEQSGNDAISVLDDKYKIRVDAERPILVKWAANKGKGKGQDSWGGKDWNKGWGGDAGKGWGGDGGYGGGYQQKGPIRTNDGFKLFVGGLPTDITEAELMTVFQTYGEVHKVHIMPANSFGKCAAFVFYASDSAGDDAIKVLHGQYKIRVDAPEAIQVRWASEKGGGKGGMTDGKGNWSGGGSWDAGKGWGGQQDWSSGGSQWSGDSWGGDKGGWDNGKGWGKDGGKGKGPPDESKLFVGNLPEDITDEALKYVFGTYGTVKNVHIMHGRSQSGAACALVDMTAPSEADTAIATLNDKYEIKPGSGAIMVKKARGGGRSQPY